MAENNAPEPRINIPYEHELSTFATNVSVRMPGEMVFLDFMQMDTWTEPPEQGRVVARLVVTERLARGLCAEFARLLPEADDA
jgi:hypothetical protein